MGHAQRRAVKLLIRPATPTGPGPVITSGHVRAKARSQFEYGSRPRSPAPSSVRTIGQKGDPSQPSNASQTLTVAPVRARTGRPRPHTVMHWGEDVALEKHYVAKRSQRARSVLTFFAQDAEAHNLVYANADLSKASQAREVLASCDHWRAGTGADPKVLALDQRVTTHEVLAELDARGMRFITLRMRTVALLGHVEAIDAKAWKTVSLDRDGNHRKPQVADELVRITNDPSPIRLAESIRSFHLDALSSAVPLNVDLDVVLSVLAGAACASLRRRLGPGHLSATSDTLQRRFLSTVERQIQYKPHHQVGGMPTSQPDRGRIKL